jgi:hypothetical protein
MCSLSRLYENELQINAKSEDTVKSNEILEEETQSLSLRCTKPIVVA